MKKFLFFTCLFGTISAFAETPKIIFEENKNQWPSQVKYQADIPGGKLFLEENTFTYYYRENMDLHHADPSKELKIKSHCYKVHFENALSQPQVSGNKRYSWHRNYYLGNDPKKWADNVPLYSQVYYKALYSNIDLQIYSEENNLKYDLIVHPGGKPADIKLNYEGTDGLHLENGHLFIKTSVYNLIEQKPYAYQVVNGVEKQVACSYVLEKNKLSFAMGSYDPALSLVIDPTLIASTYSGSTADNWGFTATYDAAGNIYMAGTASGTGYPTTVGAWDQTYNGGNYGPNAWPQDISITKFNPAGTAILFSTYYGGLNNEQPSSLVVNSSNELYVLGRTSSTNFPTTGPYQAALSGGVDMVVGKFNMTGMLLASTYLGGTLDDCVNVSAAWDTYGTTKFTFMDDLRSEIVLDQNSNVYVAASTKSANFPTTASTYQSTLSGVQDAVIFKMNSSLSSLLWSTYFGGTGTDAAYGLRLDNNNNVYITGGTSSSDLPTTSGVLASTYQGGLADGFVSVFNPSLTGSAQLLRSTYIGTSVYDQSFFIDIDASGDLYVFGQTQGAYPVTAGCYSNPNSGQFIHKLIGNLSSTVYSTVIGTGSNAVNIAPTAFEIDSCGTVYFSGWGRSSLLSGFMPSPSSTTGLPTTANAFQPTTDGRDFYIAVLSPDAKGMLYGTFFGEVGGADADHLDGGTCRFDKNGILYHAACASCGGGQGFPTTPGCYSSTNNSNHINYPLPTSPSTAVANCNEAVFKMAVGVQPIAVANAVGNPEGCAPFQVCFTSTGSLCKDLIWDYGDGSQDTIASPCHTFSFAGTYSITLYCIDSIGICGYIDTSMVVVTVGAAPTLSLTTTNASSCSSNDGAISVIAAGGYAPLTYTWSNGQSTSAMSGLSAGIYSVTVTDMVGCSSTGKDTVNCPTGIHESINSSVDFYPNPTSSLIHISHSEGISEILLNDVLGRTIQRVEKPTGRSTTLDLSLNPSGVYFLQIKTETGTLTKKLVKD